LIGVVDGGRLMFLGTLTELRGQAAHGHTSLEELYLALTASDDERLPTRRGVAPGDASAPPPAVALAAVEPAADDSGAIGSTQSKAGGTN
jgi:hypothetical protein